MYFMNHSSQFFFEEKGIYLKKKLIMWNKGSGKNLDYEFNSFHSLQEWMYTVNDQSKGKPHIFVWETP